MQIYQCHKDMKLNIQTKAKGHRSLRIGRFSQENGIYLITSSTWQQTKVFTEWPYALAAVRAFTGSGILKDTRLLAWVLMPDHAHWLIQLGEERSLSSLVGAMKSASARAVRKAGYGKQVWRTAYYDRAIRRHEDIEVAARYIVANPLRARLVRRVGDYPFWNAVYL